MISRYRRRTSALTIFLALAISLVYLQVDLLASTSSRPASAKPLTGILTTRGTAPVTVNGNTSISGTTILPVAQLVTSDKSGANVQLRELGSFDMGPNSTLAVNFNDTGIEITLSAGYVVLTTNKDINGSITTPDGAVLHTDASKVSSVTGRVKSPDAVDAAQRGSDDDDKDNGHDRGAGLLWWLTNNHARFFGFIVFGGATAGGVIFAVRGRPSRPCGPQNPSVTLPCV